MKSKFKYNFQKQAFRKPIEILKNPNSTVNYIAILKISKRMKINRNNILQN